VAALLLSVIGLACALVIAPVSSLARQDAVEQPVEVGAGPVGEPSLRFVGRSLYQPGSALLFGYLSDVIGLNASQLFVAGTPSVESARFTFVAEIPSATAANQGDVTTIAGAGTFRVYLDEAAGASWDDPGSFADGEVAAELALNLRDVVQRQAPGVGVVVGDYALRQVTAGEFTLEGERFRFGNAGIEQRLRYVGALLDESNQAPTRVAAVTGSAAVTLRSVTPVMLGSS
jgi:hypothetical protein